MTNVQLISESISMQGEKGVELQKHFSNNQLLTFQEWKKKGYSVIKGEKASFKCEIWKRVSKKQKKESDKQEYIYIKKVASFFTIDQVKPM